jgi:hypothetical protein
VSLEYRLAKWTNADEPNHSPFVFASSLEQLLKRLDLWWPYDSLPGLEGHETSNGWMVAWCECIYFACFDFRFRPTIC